MKPVASKNGVTCGRFGRDPPAARPGMEIFKLSAKTGEGMAEYLDFLESRRVLSRAAATL